MGIVSIDTRDRDADLRAARARAARGDRHRPPAGRATSCRPSASSPSSCSVNANTVARVYAELERAGVIETRRGVGSFVSATPAQAHPPREHERRLRAFVTRVLADADAAGFTVDDVIEALEAHK